MESKNDKLFWVVSSLAMALIVFSYPIVNNSFTYSNVSNPYSITYELPSDSLRPITDEEMEMLDKTINDTLANPSHKAKKTTTKKASVKHKYSMSKTGKDFIKEKESLKLSAYRINGEKLLTIGYGHQIQKNESYETIDEATAEKIFNEDIEKVNASINRILSEVNSKFEFSQGFIDGLGSLIYNCGEAGVKKTEFYSRLKKCRYDESTSTNINDSDLSFTLAAVKTTHVYLKGHKVRRIQEHNLMKS